MDKQQNSCRAPVSQTLLMTTTHQCYLRGRRRNRDRYADTHRGWRKKSGERLFALGIFGINKQFNMSVPQKSHQQSVRTTISEEIRSVYTMSPKVTSPAQKYITYYNSTLATAGHSRSKSRSTLIERI